MRYLINVWLKSTEYISESSKNNFSAKKWSFSLSISSVNVTKSAGALVTFTEEILNGKLHFLAVLSFDYFTIKN